VRSLVIDCDWGAPIGNGLIGGAHMTDNRTAEDALKVSEAELRQALAQLTEGQRLSKTGSFTSDIQQDRHRWSDEFYRIFEIDPATPPHIEAVRARIHPDDLQLFDAEILRRKEGTGGDFNFRIVTPKGGLKHLRGVAQVIELVEGRPVFVGSIQDVTKSKLAEDELQRSEAYLLEGQRLAKTGSYLWLLNTDRVPFFSAEMNRIFGFEHKPPTTVQEIFDRFHPDDLPLGNAAIETARSGHDIDFVFRLRMQDGSIKYLRSYIRAAQMRDGQLELMGTVQDITESRLAEEALNLARSELAHVARVATLNAMTASIAHEVSQPLSGILTNANTGARMLAADPPNLAGAAETVRRTIRDAHRASEVLSRIRAMFSKKAPGVEMVNLNDTAREVIALSSGELQKSHALLQTDLADDLPFIHADRVQLQQVILNLLLNAADAMTGVEDRPRTLLVKTERVHDGSVKLAVRDCGVGVDPDAVEKLFEAFYTTKAHGMGIGLSICRTIIESHHGHLSGAPNDGPGATFTFCIPCASQVAHGVALCETTTDPTNWRND
jgi:signal transduction histidine kinase